MGPQLGLLCAVASRVGTGFEWVRFLGCAGEIGLGAGGKAVLTGSLCLFYFGDGERAKDELNRKVAKVAKNGRGGLLHLEKNAYYLFITPPPLDSGGGKSSAKIGEKKEQAGVMAGPRSYLGVQAACPPSWLTRPR
jgi:hypothetical protein